MSNRSLRTPLGYRHAQSKLRVHRGSPPPLPPLPSAYTLSGKVIAELSAALLWIGMWLFNGYCTMVAFALAARWLAARAGHVDDVWLSQWLLYPVGTAAHISISAMEQHLWRTLDSATVPTALTIQQRTDRLFRSVRTWESVAVGVLDSLTTSTVLVHILAWFGLFGLPGVVVASAVGTALALVCEPMMRFHGLGLRLLLRGGRE